MPKRTPLETALSKDAEELAARCREDLVIRSAGSVERASQLRRRLIASLWRDEYDHAHQGCDPDLAIPRSAQHIVIFLGAGASYPLGYPVTADILPAIWQGLNPKPRERGWKAWAGFTRQGVVKGKKKRVPRPEIADELREFLCTVMPGLSKDKTSLSGASIIEVISLLEHSIAERRSPMPPTAALQAAGKGRGSSGARLAATEPAAALLRARHLLNMGINGVLQGRRKSEIVKALAAWMAKRAFHTRSRQRVTLVSTNYDTALEQKLYEEVRERDHEIEEVVDFGFTWRDLDGSLRHRPSEAPLAVYKLHGSLNWLRCELCGHVTINTEQRIASLDFWERQNTYNSCECGGLLKSLLVTPSVVRDVRDASLLAVWSAALEDLRNADHWIIIGYSLPPEDVAIRSLLLRAIHSRVKPNLDVGVVSYESGLPDAPRSPSDAFRLFLPKETFGLRAYEHRGIEAFVDSLAKS